MSEKAPYKYKLKFVPDALEEWNNLDGSVKETLRKLLKKRLDQPHVPGSELHGNLQHCYKIKLRKQGYRLVYVVEDDALVVMVLAVDKREDSTVYESAAARLKDKVAGAVKTTASSPPKAGKYKGHR